MALPASTEGSSRLLYNVSRRDLRRGAQVLDENARSRLSLLAEALSVPNRHHLGERVGLMRRPCSWASRRRALLPAAAHAASRCDRRSAEGAPVFGQNEVKVQVGGERVNKVEVYVNGKLVGTMTKQPTWFSTPATTTRSVRSKWSPTALPGRRRQRSAVFRPIRSTTPWTQAAAVFVTVSRAPGAGARPRPGGLPDRDNGKSQRVTFGKGELPLTAVLLLDTSESMQERRWKVRARGRRLPAGMKPLDERRW